jgi:hypothetical protein
MMQQFCVICFLFFLLCYGGDVATYTWKMEDPVVRDGDYLVAPVNVNSSFVMTLGAILDEVKKDD